MYDKLSRSSLKLAFILSTNKQKLPVGVPQLATFLKGRLWCRCLPMNLLFYRTPPGNRF